MKHESPAIFRAAGRRGKFGCVVLAVALALGGEGCFTDEQGEAYYGRVVVPRRQEFRWSDGGVPKVLDPARAAAPPDTDAVRALFEGLTDYDPRTLDPVPAVAARWEQSADGRVWTFYLRRDARWSNGDAVTAQDFLRSWRRALRLGDAAPHAELLANLRERPPATRAPRDSTQPPRASAGVPPAAAGDALSSAEPRLAVEGIGEHAIRIRLRRPDKNLPSLLAHPVFRPVHSSVSEDAGDTGGVGDDREGEVGRAAAQPVSNGAFRVGESGENGVVLERDANYWNAGQVALERVRFVAARDAESALASYRAGELDAVTNADVEPAGLKLLASYGDFRRTAYGALTYYDFNATRPPFDDLRVRQALAAALDRRRLSADTLGGATEPAEQFLPPAGEAAAGKEGGGLRYDPERARRLLSEAGYPGGTGFPRVRLLVNRNDQHRLVAEAVAGMWRAVLGVETEIFLLDWEEYETRLRTGEYDLAKRSALMQTPDEETNLLAMFDPRRLSFEQSESDPAGDAGEAQQAEGLEDERRTNGAPESSAASLPAPVTSEAQALNEVPAIPLYFASSFSLVKPYVRGFDANMLDAPSLRRVRIDTGWRQPAQGQTANSGGD